MGVKHAQRSNVRESAPRIANPQLHVELQNVVSYAKSAERERSAGSKIDSIETVARSVLKWSVQRNAKRNPQDVSNQNVEIHVRNVQRGKCVN